MFGKEFYWYRTFLKVYSIAQQQQQKNIFDWLLVSFISPKNELILMRKTYRKALEKNFKVSPLLANKSLIFFGILP